MEIKDFVQKVIEQIRAGISSFNRGDKFYTACMPNKIELTIKVFGDRIAIHTDDPSKVHEIKLSIDIQTYVGE